ncbi:hypothetical protein K2173_004181 [Erythroxylum novogranatense]|uniref:F-box domain-containing protein n=1 Tax=Erythroxylum novogranatense TaxID=1862640 RepID=A0AAV8SYP8_9ROSI|nr:hypothetical protein K2173_004181 [Erythroxylum novogranatense]
MALGKRCSSMKLSRGVEEEEQRRGLEFVQYTRSFGRKRIWILNNEVGLVSLDSATPSTPLKRLCSGKMTVVDDGNETQKSHLESLPQDILVRVLCCVSHDDLKQLLMVSRAISEATLIAKKLHFEYSTPRKVRAFRCSVNFENPNELGEIEAPNAPKQSRSHRSRLSKRSLADISVALFSSPTKKGLFKETEM